MRGMFLSFPSIADVYNFVVLEYSLFCGFCGLRYLFEDGDHPYANNVFANLQGSATAEDVVTIPPWVLQAPGDTHLIDAMVGDGPVEEETLLHIPAASK